MKRSPSFSLRIFDLDFSFHNDRQAKRFNRCPPWRETIHRVRRITMLVVVHTLPVLKRRFLRKANSKGKKQRFGIHSISRSRVGTHYGGGIYPGDQLNQIDKK